MAQENPFAEFDAANGINTTGAFDGFDEQIKQERLARAVDVPGVEDDDTDGRSLGDVLNDFVVAPALKGTMGLTDSIIGLADIPTGGRVGKFLEDTGYNPNATREGLDEHVISDEQKAANAAFEEADGFVDSTKAALKHPSVILNAVTESAPQILGGGLAAKGIVKAAPKISGAVAAGAGEGLMAAGSSAESQRQESEGGRLNSKQTLAAVTAGVNTALLGAFGAKVANKLGVKDVDSILTGAAGKAKTSFPKALISGGITEGVFEELPQSVQEQMLTNWANDKPLTEGVDKAASLGMLSGAAMGAGVQAVKAPLSTADEIRAKSKKVKEKIAEKKKQKARLNTNNDLLAQVQEATDTPTPEAPETLTAQAEAVNDGRKSAMLVTDGEQIPDNIDPEAKAVDTNRGTVIYKDDAVADTLANEGVGAALDYGISEKPEGATEVVTARDENGTVIQDALTDGSQSIIEAAQKVAGSNGSVEIRPAQEALVERQQNTDPVNQVFNQKVSDIESRGYNPLDPVKKQLGYSEAFDYYKALEKVKNLDLPVSERQAALETINGIEGKLTTEQQPQSNEIVQLSENLYQLEGRPLRNPNPDQYEPAYNNDGDLIGWKPIGENNVSTDATSTARVATEPSGSEISDASPGDGNMVSNVSGTERDSDNAAAPRSGDGNNLRDGDTGDGAGDRAGLEREDSALDGDNVDQNQSVTRETVDAKANEAATSPQNDLDEPSQAQKEAGNYKVGRVKVGGLDISVENPDQSTRSGKDPDGNEWQSTMNGHYGYVKGVPARGNDKDHVDVNIKPSTAEDYDGDVYVINQVDPNTGKFDEHKVYIGYGSETEARDAYQSNYEEGWQGLDSVATLSMDQFKKKLQSKSAFKKPFKTPTKAAPKPKKYNLLTQLRDLGGILHQTAPDITGERHFKNIRGGYGRVFRKDAQYELQELIQDGSLDDFVPFNARSTADARTEEDIAEAYEYLTTKIANGDSVLPYEDQLAIDMSAAYDEGQSEADIDTFDIEADDAVINQLLQEAGYDEQESATESRDFGAENAEVAEAGSSSQKVENTAEKNTDSVADGSKRETPAAARTKTRNEVTRTPASNERSEARPVIESIVKMRRSAQELGKLNQFNSYLDKAKAFLNGEDVKPSSFKTAVRTFKKLDPDIGAEYQKLADMAQGQQEPGSFQALSSQIENANDVESLMDLAQIIQSDNTISDDQAAKLDDAIMVKLDGLSNADLLGDDTAKKQAVADAERAKDEARNNGVDDQDEFKLTGSNRDADQASASGAQDLFVDANKKVESKPDQETNALKPVSELNREEVKQEIDRIVDAADARRAEAQKGLSGDMILRDTNPYMPKEDVQRLHDLRLALPTHGQEALEARERIQERIKARKKKSESKASQQDTPDRSAEATRANGQDDATGANEAEAVAGSEQEATRDGNSGEQLDAESLKDTSDVGGELGFNRRSKGFTKSDIDSAENDAQRVQMAVKKKLWEKPDYEAMVEAGIAPEAAHVIKQIYDSISTKPTRMGRIVLDAYVETVEATKNAVEELVSNAENVEQFLAAVAKNKPSYMMMYTRGDAASSTINSMAEAYEGEVSKDLLLDAAFPKNEGGNRWGSANRHGNDKALATGKKLYKALDVDHSMLRKAIKAVREESWPAKQEAWQKKYKIEKTDDGYQLKTKTGWPVGDPHKTEAKAIEAAKKEAAPKQRKEKFKEPETLVKNAVRKGQGVREGNVSTKELQEAINLKAINFGNWMQKDANAKERQDHVNAAYDAFHDLAAALNLPVKAMSLGGDLGLAIGAQGKGKYAAHFVPGFNEINLTRKQGAGSLAHEWAHALDHYFGVQAGMVGEKDPFASHLGFYRLDRKYNDLRPEVKQAFKTIYDTMNRRTEDADTAKKRHQQHYEYAKEKVDKLVETFGLVDKAGNDKALTEAISDIKNDSPESTKMVELPSRKRMKDTIYKSVNAFYQEDMLAKDEALMLSSAIGSLRYTKEAVSKEPELRSVHTEFYKNAQALESGSGKPYWTTPHELFARAFEIYVGDKLAEKGQKNTYLTAGWKFEDSKKGEEKKESEKWFPRNEDREAINAAFDTLFAEIKHKETGDSNVVLFKRTQSPEVNQHGFSTKRAEQIADELAKRYPNVPKVKLYNNHNELPIDQKYIDEINSAAREKLNRIDQAKTLSETVAAFSIDVPSIQGVYLNGEIMINLDAITDEAHFKRIFAHEGIGHLSVEQMLNEVDPSLMPKLQKQIINLNKLGNKYISSVWKDVEQNQPGISENNKAKEVLAYIAERGDHQKEFTATVRSIWQKIVDGIKAFAKLVFDVDMTDQDVRDIVAQAERYARGESNKSDLISVYANGKPNFSRRANDLAETVTVNGKQRPTTNSEGNPIHSTLEGVKNFWEWFDGHDVGNRADSVRKAKKSKNTNGVSPDNDAGQGRPYGLDREGKPRRFYHGSVSTFEKFALDHSDKKDVGWLGDGIYLTDSPELASHYADVKKGNSGPNVMPLYAALHNPYYADLELKQSLKGASKDERDRFNKYLDDHNHDGVVFSLDSTTDEVMVRNPNQVKSVSGNNGDFSQDNDSILFSKTSSEQAAELPEESNKKAFQRKVQDKFNRFKVIQDWLKEQGVKLSESADVYLAETLMSGRVSTQKEDFRETQLKPLIEKTQQAGFNMDQVADYLKAQHAPEANKRARELQGNPQATAYGVTDKEAREVMQEFGALDNFNDLKDIANEWRAITEQTKQLKIESGLLTPEMVEAWEQTYQHYVPVKGRDENQKVGLGKGLHVNARNRMRMGHGLRDEAIIENILRDHESAITLAEKNRVGKALIKLLLEAKNDAIGTIAKPVKRKVLKQGETSYIVSHQGQDIGAFDTDKEAKLYVDAQVATGLTRADFAVEKTKDPVRVMLQASPLLEDNEVHVYVNGHAIRVQINDELAAQAYKNMGVEHLHSVLSAGREVNNWLSKVYTGYSPDFIFTNPIRDAIQGSIVLTGNHGVGMTAKIYKRYPKAVAELMKHFRENGSSELVNQYREHGGSTGGAYLTDLERIGNDIQASFNEYQGALQTYKTTYEKAIADGKSKKLAHTKASLRAGAAGFKKIPMIGHFLKLMESINAIAENALRVATFDTLSNNGVTKDQAAFEAKELMNFNRKGEYSNVAGALYLFFNPAVQGNKLIYESLVSSPHKNQARALTASMTLAAYTLASLATGGDEEDRERWENTPDYVKDSNIVLNFAGKQITITLPYGYRIFWALGNVLHDVEHGKDTDKLGIRFANLVAENFSPMGAPISEDGDVNVVQVLPTAIKMGAGASEGVNQDGFGRPITPSKYKDSIPDSQLMYRGTHGSLYDGVAAKLNELSGGTEYEAGYVDVSPETLKYWVKSITGGTGQFFADSFNITAWALQGEAPQNIKDVPIARRFAREVGVRDSRSKFWEIRNQVTEAADQLAAAKKDGNVDAYKDLWNRKGELYAQARLSTRMLKMANAKRDAVQKIRNDDSLTLKQKNTQIRKLEKQEQAVYDLFLKQYELRTK